VRRALLCLACLLLTVGTHAGEDAAQKAAELKQLRHKIGALQEELQSNRKKKSRADKRLRDIERQVSLARRELSKLDRALAGLRRELAGLDDRRQRAAASLKRQSTELAREARAAYAMGRQQQVKLLLNQEEPAAVGRMLVYFSYFSRARQARIATMRDTLQELETLEADIESKNRSLLSLQEEQRSQAARLQAKQRQREQVVTRLQRRLHSQGGELRRLQEDEKQLQALLASLQALLADIPADAGQQKPFKALKGQLHWPARGRLARRFGSLRGHSGLKWQGVLIEAPEGGQVRAVSQGRVVFADWMRGFGLLLIIDHGDGYMTLYGRNQALYKEVGEWVDSGEVVATLGASGGQTDAGLYFEIRHNGHPVNPLGWCAGKPAAGAG
jgi:septal ring factor EnvC (AmiA/AmiB activator)